MLMIGIDYHPHHITINRGNHYILDNIQLQKQVNLFKSML